MEERYQPKIIEEKWQRRWTESDAFHVVEDTASAAVASRHHNSEIRVSRIESCPT